MAGRFEDALAETEFERDKPCESRLISDVVMRPWGPEPITVPCGATPTRPSLARIDNSPILDSPHYCRTHWPHETRLHLERLRVERGVA